MVSTYPNIELISLEPVKEANNKGLKKLVDVIAINTVCTR